MKDQKGITLIALVITIIVLLILAGVSIAMLTGENGILTKAVQAGDDTKLSDSEETIKLAVNEILVDKNGKLAYNATVDTDNSIKATTLQEALNKLSTKYTLTASGTGATITVTANDGTTDFATFTVNAENGKVTRTSPTTE